MNKIETLTSTTCDQGHELAWGTPVAKCEACGFTYVAIFREPIDCLKCKAKDSVIRTKCRPDEPRVEKAA